MNDDNKEVVIPKIDKKEVETPKIDNNDTTRLSYYHISKLLDSLQPVQKAENDDELKNENKQRRELGFNNTAVSRIASQGLGLFDTLMSLTSNANVNYIIPFNFKIIFALNTLIFAFLFKYI